MPAQKVRPSRKRPVPAEQEERGAPPVPSGKIKRASAFLGGAVLMLVVLGILAWLGIQRNNATHLTSPGSATNSMATVSQVSALLAEGVTLGAPSRSATLSQQQAMQLASQFEPDAATKAKGVAASYVTISYAPPLASASSLRLNNVAAWMIWYQRVPYVPADANVDPTPFPHSYHDLYVFIDATTGREILSVWA